MILTPIESASSRRFRNDLIDSQIFVRSCHTVLCGLCDVKRSKSSFRAFERSAFGFRLASKNVSTSSFLVFQRTDTITETLKLSFVLHECVNSEYRMDRGARALQSGSINWLTAGKKMVGPKTTLRPEENDPTSFSYCLLPGIGFFRRSAFSSATTSARTRFFPTVYTIMHSSFLTLMASFTLIFSCSRKFSNKDTGPRTCSVFPLR